MADRQKVGKENVYIQKRSDFHLAYTNGMTVAAVLTAILLAPPPTIEMAITTDGKEVGAAWMSQKLDVNGKKTYAKLIMGDVKIVETAEYTIDGSPKLKIITRTEKGVSATTQASFADGKVTVTAGKESATVAFPEKGTLRALSELWFLQTKPAKGHTVEYQRFDIYGGKFVPCKVVYLGKDDIEVQGKKVSANRVRVDNKTDAWLDERGDPYRMIIDGKTKFERTAP